MKKTIENNKLVLYRSKDGSVKLEAALEQETLWLNLNQLAKLFGRDKSVISRHLRNIFKTKELDSDSVVAKNATTAADGKVYQVDWYNLDAIISVGYRVNSKRGTEFRIWATKILRDHLVKGYTQNPKRLAELKKTLKLASEITKRKDLSGEEATAILRTITDYAYALELLDDYDHQRVTKYKITKGRAKPIKYDEAIDIINKMRELSKFSELFGAEKDQSLHSSLNAITQSFDGKDLYPSLEEKAANLLYFLVKNHSFVDGNKRIAAVIFLQFLERNKLLYRKDGSQRIANNALVAITLMIAESKPEEKEVITAMITNLVNKHN
ncbi:MAG: virulence protein RhuM/Fic/DOC family protein [Gammaproteobacteria bacterium]|jgi:prophage maintenance system killer protein